MGNLPLEDGFQSRTKWRTLWERTDIFTRQERAFQLVKHLARKVDRLEYRVENDSTEDDLFITGRVEHFLSDVRERRDILKVKTRSDTFDRVDLAEDLIHVFF